MKTAVEWYAEQEVKLTIDFLANKINELEYGIKRVKLLEQAKEMEKEQIMSSWHNGLANQTEFFSDHIGTIIRANCAERYYNETFKSE